MNVTKLSRTKLAIIQEIRNLDFVFTDISPVSLISLRVFQSLLSKVTCQKVKKSQVFRYEEGQHQWQSLALSCWIKGVDTKRPGEHYLARPYIHAAS